MALEETLRKVRYDLARGDLDHARQRLTGLLCHFAYPQNLEIRRMLGDIHWQQGNLIEAGRYWYLEVDKTPEMLDAVARYEKACGNDPQIIGRRLKFYTWRYCTVAFKIEYPNVYQVINDLARQAWGDFSYRYPFGTFQLWDPEAVSRRTETRRLLIVDGTGQLWATTLQFVEDDFPFQLDTFHSFSHYGLLKNITLISEFSPDLTQISNQEKVNHLKSLVLDFNDRQAFHAKLSAIVADQGAFDVAIVLLPDTLAGIHDILSEYVLDAYWHVLNLPAIQKPVSIPVSSFSQSPPSYQQIVLGWAEENDQARRLTDAEIADGILEATRSGHIRWRVGSIGPWMESSARHEF